MQGKSVLVTGAGGFIGSHLVEQLVVAGARVRAFVHYRARDARGWLAQSPHRGEIEFVAGDICDRDSITAAVDGQEMVFHLAALIAIPYSYQAPLSYVRSNIEGTLNVLQACRGHGVSRLIHTSTSEVYGTARRVPMDEQHPLQAQSPYAASKIGADQQVVAFQRSFGLPAVTLRPFNTFGPRQSARAVIPTIMLQCLAGNNIRLGNLHPRRDLTFVGDTVTAYLRAAESDEAIGRVINIGAGREVSIAELVELIAAISGSAVAIEAEARRLRPAGSEVDRLLADTSLARELLNWQPQLSLEEGLRRTFDWFRQNRGLFGEGDYLL